MKMVAGKDGTELFDKYHKWVNIDFIMSKCLIGPLATEYGDTPSAVSEDADDPDFDLEREAIENALSNERMSGLSLGMDEVD